MSEPGGTKQAAADPERIADHLRNGGGESLRVQSEGIAVILEILRNVPTREEVKAIVSSEMAQFRARLEADGDASLAFGKLSAKGRSALRVVALAILAASAVVAAAIALSPHVAELLQAWKG